MSEWTAVFVIACGESSAATIAVRGAIDKQLARRRESMGSIAERFCVWCILSGLANTLPRDLSHGIRFLTERIHDTCNLAALLDSSCR